jgi:hypothetical protein
MVITTSPLLPTFNWASSKTAGANPYARSPAPYSNGVFTVIIVAPNWGLVEITSAVGWRDDPAALGIQFAPDEDGDNTAETHAKKV